MALGAYPETSLKKSRSDSENTRKQLAECVDPSAQKALEKLTAKVSRENTFKAVEAEWLSKIEREGRAEATL